jgi:hypothetical protein
MNKIVEEKLPDLIRICQRHGIRRIELFGSAARDDFQPNVWAYEYAVVNNRRVWELAEVQAPSLRREKNSCKVSPAPKEARPRSLRRREGVRVPNAEGQAKESLKR